MSEKERDKQLGMGRPIARRDFLNGVAVSIGAGLTQGFLPGLERMSESVEQSPQDRPRYYPPTLTGMRGSHDGSFEAAHSERDGDFWKNAGTPVDTGEAYDLTVVGGGMSGLAAAYFSRKQDPSARILILDNHDDFGGHAKRNEFHVIDLCKNNAIIGVRKGNTDAQAEGKCRSFGRPAQAGFEVAR